MTSNIFPTASTLCLPIFTRHDYSNRIWRVYVVLHIILPSSSIIHKFCLADYIQNVGTGTVLDLASGMYIVFMSLPNFSLNAFQALAQIVCTRVLFNSRVMLRIVQIPTFEATRSAPSAIAGFPPNFGLLRSIKILLPTPLRILKVVPSWIFPAVGLLVVCMHHRSIL